MLKSRETGRAICGYGAHDQTRNGSADRQQADKDRAAALCTAIYEDLQLT